MSDPEHYKTTFANGLTLVAERHPQVRALSIGVWVRVGSSLEPKELNGISHFLEHMVFKGTEGRTRFEIATALESLGGDLNAFTDREYTCFHATVLSEHLDIALDVLAELCVRPTFPRAELERERKVLLQELSMVEDSPEESIGDLFCQAVWKNEPLGQPVIGNRKTIQTMTRASLTKYFKEHYRGENIVISVAGNIEFQSLRDKVEKAFEKAPAHKRPRAERAPSRFHAKKKIVSSHSDQLHLLLGFEGPGFRDPTRFDALILSFFLGGGMSSRLFQEVREKAGLAYTVECDCVPFSDTGLFSVYVSMNPRSLKGCLAILAREFKRLASEPLSKEALAVVKSQIKGTILLSSDQMEVRQESLGRNELIFRKYIPIESVIDTLEEVSPDRIQALAKRLFVKDKEAAVLLGSTQRRAENISVFD